MTFMNVSIKEISSGICIPDPSNRVAENHAFYSAYYNKFGIRDDSPSGSRLSLIRRASSNFANLKHGEWVLDLGSGRQILEYEYADCINSLGVNWIALDIAEFDKSKLLTSPNIDAQRHLRASGSNLPFATEGLSGMVSNMALDFMPREAIQDLFRSLKYGSHLLLNLHHPSLIPSDLDHQISKNNRAIRHKIDARPSTKEKLQLERAALAHKRYLRDNRVLFSSTTEINDTFSSYGFYINRVGLGGSPTGERWWEADLQKV